MKYLAGREEKAQIHSSSFSSAPPWPDGNKPHALSATLCSDGYKLFAALAALFFHMLWSGQAMGDTQLAMWSGSEGHSP